MSLLNPTVDVLQSFQPTQRYLSPGERILWSGQPKQGIAFCRSDLLAIPFSLMWGGFAIFWNVGVWTDVNTGTADDWFFRLWGLPFLAVGIYLIVGRFFYDAWVRRRSYYAVTNQRVLILRNWPTLKLTSREIRSLPMVELTEHRDGTGTIAFDSEAVGYSSVGRNRGLGAWSPAVSANAQFFRIDNPQRVYELVRRQS
jgi:hypothetical protein